MGNCMEKKAAVSDEGISYGGNVHQIVDKEQWDEEISDANNKGKKVTVNFSASWCDPCRMIAPFYAELSIKYPSLLFLAVDVDELADFSSSWDIQATPTFFFLKEGQKFDQHVGSDKAELEKKLMELLD